MKNERRKSPGPRFSGPTVDALTGLNSNTRRAGEARGVLTPDEEGEYDFEQLARAAAWAEIARLGIQARGTRDYLIRAIVQEMREQKDAVGEEHRFLVLCAAPDVNFGHDRPAWPPPLVKRMMDGGVIGLADGNGAACIVGGLTRDDLRQHFAWSAETGADVATAVFNTTALLMRLLRRIAEHRRREEARP